MASCSSVAPPPLPPPVRELRWLMEACRWMGVGREGSSGERERQGGAASRKGRGARKGGQPSREAQAGREGGCAEGISNNTSPCTTSKVGRNVANKT